MSPAPRPARPATNCVVPAHNEAAHPPLPLPRLVAQPRALADPWAVPVVDGGSADATPEAIRARAATVTGVTSSSGVQLLSIGIPGEHVGRVFDEVEQRPIHLVGSQAGRSVLQGRRPSRLPPPGVRETSRRADDVGRCARRA